MIEKIIVLGAILLAQTVGYSQAQQSSKEGDVIMKYLETKRFILRPFTAEDWSDLQELAVDWRSAPGPDFDKWGTTEEFSRGFAKHLSAQDKFFALCLRDTKKVIGLLGLNGIDKNKQLDLGHVIHSKYQDNDHDKEALEAIINYIFETKGASSVVTRNASTHTEQLAPLKSLGFKNINRDEKGELVITKVDWQQKQES